MTKMTKGLLSGLLCLVLCLSCFFAACGKKPVPEAEPTTEPAAQKVAHTVTVKTSNGEPLQGIGVYVYTDSTMAELVWFAKTDDLGTIAFTDVIGDSYVAVLADVPQGYVVEDQYPLTGTDTQILLESVLLSEDDLEGVSVGLGDMMFDFTVTDTDGNTYTLSQLLQEKEAVVLNFWFLECQPCMAEFPYLQEVYMEHSDRVAVLAVNPVNTDEAAVKQRKADLGLSFPVALVDPAWAEALGVTAYPTTVIIDRFGKVGLIHTGSVPSAAGFRAAFEPFLGEDYQSTVVENADELVNVKDTKGTAEDPYEFGGVTSFEVTVEPGQTVHVRLYKAFDMYMQIKSKDAYVIKGGKTYKPEDGKVGLTVNCEDTYTSLALQIGNSGSKTQTFTVTLTAKSGTIGNPKTFKLGDFEVKVPAGNEQGVYYQFSAPKTGVLTVECLGGTAGVEYNFALYNLSSYAYRTLDADGEGNSLSVKVKKGQTIQFIMFTVPDESFKYPAGTFQMRATLTDGTEEEEEEQIPTGTYTVTVTDALGNPMAGVMMKVEGTEHSSVLTTDASGVASAQLALGDYTVTVTVPAGYTAEDPVLHLTAETLTAELVLAQVTTDYADYKVTVLAPDGATPIENALVIIGEAMAYTDAAGTVTASLEVGDYQIYVSNLDPIYATAQSYYTFPEGSCELTVTLVYTPGTEHNPIIIDSNPYTTGKIAPGTLVHYRAYEMGGMILEIQDADAFVIYGGTTYGADTQGVVRVTLGEEVPAALILGTVGTEKEIFTLTFRAVGLPEDPTDPTEETTEATEETTEETTQETTEENTVPEETQPEETEPTEPEGEAEYTVTVTDYAGNPAAGVTVAVYDEAQNLVKTGLTDSDGRTVLEMERAAYTVRLLATSAYYEKADAVLTPVDTALTILLAAEPDESSTVDMWICDNGSAYNIPVGGTHVRLGSGQFGYSTETGVTFFAFTPTQSGIYRFTTTNPGMAIDYWGGTFFPNRSTPADYADNAFTMTVQEGNLGASYALGIEGSGECALVITRLGDADVDPSYLPYEPYTGTIVPEPFSYTGGALTDVDYTGATADYTLVYNDRDGLYHIGAKDGPVLYANLVSGRFVSIYNMVNGQGNIGAQPFRAAFYNSKGQYIKEDYTELMQQYTQCADSATGVYPVNQELMYMLRKGIEYNGWADSDDPNYLFKGADGNALENINPELAWMFLFCFEAGA